MPWQLAQLRALCEKLEEELRRTTAVASEMEAREAALLERTLQAERAREVMREEMDVVLEQVVDAQLALCTPSGEASPMRDQVMDQPVAQAKSEGMRADAAEAALSSCKVRNREILEEVVDPPPDTGHTGCNA